VDGFEALCREQRSLKAFYTAGQSAPTCGCQLIINLPFGIGCLGSTLFRGGRALQAFGDAIAKVLEHPTFPRLNVQSDFAGVDWIGADFSRRCIGASTPPSYSLASPGVYSFPDSRVKREARLW
jgi:hypothetical protein